MKIKIILIVIKEIVMKLAYFQRCRCFMNKNDYIKILREFQNEVNEDVIFLKNVIMKKDQKILVNKKMNICVKL